MKNYHFKACRLLRTPWLLLLVTMLPAQTNVEYQDSSGRSTGRASVRGVTGPSLYFYQSNGATSGYAEVQSDGKSVRYFNATGSQIGQQVSAGNTTYFYDSSGRALGKAVRSGSSTTYYDPSGRIIGQEQVVGGHSAYLYDSSGALRQRAWFSGGTPRPSFSSPVQPPTRVSNTPSPAPTPVFAPRFLLNKPYNRKEH